MLKRPSLLKCRSGSTAVIFALVLIPLIAAAGVAIDYSRKASEEAILQENLQSAIWAASYFKDDKNTAREEAGKAHFWSSVPPEYKSDIKDLIIKVKNDGVISGTANVVAPTTLMNVVGIHNYAFAINAQTTRQSSGSPPNPKDPNDDTDIPTGCADTTRGGGSGGPIWHPDNPHAPGQNAPPAQPPQGGGIYVKCQ